MKCLPCNFNEISLLKDLPEHRDMLVNTAGPEYSMWPLVRDFSENDVKLHNAIKEEKMSAALIYRDLRKTISYFIVKMAVSDLLFPLIAIPHQIAGFVSVSWHWRFSGILGSIFCKLYLFVVEVSLFVSAQSLVWIAIDRFVAVAFPIKRGLIFTKIRTIAIVSTWIFGGIFYFPMLITWGLVERGNNKFCGSGNLKSTFPSEEVGKGYYCLHLTLRFFSLCF